MNLKKLFLILLFTSSIIALKAMETQTSEPENEWAPLTGLSPWGQQQLNKLYKDKKVVSIAIRMFSTTLPDNQDEPTKAAARRGLQYACKDHRETTATVVHDFIASRQFHYMEPIIATDYSILDTEIPGKRYTARKELEGLAGIKERDGITSLCRGGWWGWLRGKNEECKNVRNNLATYHQAREQKKQQ